MSWLKLRVLVFAIVLGVAALDSFAPASAAPPASLSPVDAMQQAAMHNEMGPPVMAQASQYEASAPIHAFKAPASAPIAKGVTNPRLFREVFGFAYASSIGDPTVGYPSWNFSLLSTVAYFGLHVAWNGALVGDSGMTTWNDPNGPVPTLISTAHANGTKVVLTIIMQDSTAGTPNMCSALQYTSTTISQTVAQVVAKHIDGVNVDYESNNTSCRIGSGSTTESSQTMFTSFIKSLRAALPSGSYLTVDTYSGSAGYRSGTTYYGFFDVGGLASYVDAFFVMAYDMEYSNAYAAPLNCASFCIGPTAPLTTYLYNDSRASSDYRAVVPGSKVIMGIPYYGRKVCVGGYTPSNAPPNAVASGSAAADGYLDASTENGYSANSNYHIHRDSVDSAGATRWDTFTSSTASCTRELYFDDPTSLSNKYNLIIKDGLRGAGIWTLSYGGGAPELWSLINNKFGKCANATISADHSSPQIPGTLVTFTGDAFCAGNPEFRFWSKPPGGTWTVAQSYSPTPTLAWDTTGKALGTYSFEADARNLGSSVSYDTEQQMLMRLALCVTPTLSPDHPSPQLPGTTVTFTSNVTCQGTPDYRFWVKAPGGAWTIAQDYGPSSTFVWNTAGHAYGNYGLEVDTRVHGTSVSYESVMPVTFSLDSCINTTLAADKTSPQPTGGTITLTSTATCVGTNQYRYWVRAPAGAWTIVRDYSPTSTFAWTPGDPGGDYSLEVDARGASASAGTMVPASLTYTVTTCSGAALTASLTQPQMPGAVITLTGSATCAGTPQYRFWIETPGGAWAIVQDYGAASTYSWNTAGKAIGFYGLEVDVRNAGATSSYETTANQQFSIAAQPCATPTLAAGIASPQPTGTAVKLTATTSGCPNPIYRFWVQPPGGAWQSLRAYTSAPTFTWYAGGPPGTWGLEVDVRDVSRSTLPYDAVANSTYTLTGCSAATVSTDLASPQPVGARVTVNGGATCPAAAQFRFWVQAPGSRWSMAQDFSASSTYSWNTVGLAGGSYGLEVDVRDQGATAAYEQTATTIFTLSPPCGQPGLASSVTSPQNAGVPVTFTGSTSGCSTPTYRFWVRSPGGVWSVAQDYGTSATFNWAGGTAAGTYGFEVDVRNQGSVASYDGTTNIAYLVTPSPACSGAGGVSASPSPAGTGSAVTLTASPAPTGCPTPQYRFWVQAPGSAWVMVRDYSTTNTYAWPGGGTAGSYRVEVDFRGLGETTAYDMTNAITLSLAACSSATLTANPAATASRGTPVLFTGSASCLGTPQYRFWVKAPGGRWSIAQDYSASATLSWKTAGLPAGTYQVEVDVRNTGAAAAYETVANLWFALT